MSENIRTEIDVTGATPYPIFIGTDLEGAIARRASEHHAGKVLIIHQEPVSAYATKIAQQLEDSGIQAFEIALAEAEDGKTLESASMCWDKLGEWEFSRGDLVIGVGGGAATDLAGFVAATWMRGIKVINVPTTLLAMVDAAVGGKTGINTAAGKNLVGAFHEPLAVYIDLTFLKTLPKSEIVAGSAEIVKTGFIADPVIIERYEEDPAASLDPEGFLPELIERSVRVKAGVVGQDLKESGLREILNYGHTFGHAVELREHFSWRHGNAVAVGLVFAATLATNRGVMSEELRDRHINILRSLGLPTSYEPEHFDELLQGMRRDKKNKGGHIRFVVIDEIGHPLRIEDASDAELETVYEQISSH